MSCGAEELRSTFGSTAGGVMTDEAGAATGELELRTWIEDEGLALRVRYVGAEEWYSVAGAPVRLAGVSTGSHPEVHERIVDHLKRPNGTVDGNERAVSLADLGFR